LSTGGEEKSENKKKCKFSFHGRVLAGRYADPASGCSFAGLVDSASMGQARGLNPALNDKALRAEWLEAPVF
jgi:hypothetical protein